MELGVVLTASDIGFDWPALREFVQAIDEAGFSYVTTNDHVVGGHPDRAGGERVHTYDVPIHEPLTLLSFIAAATPRLGVVTSVLLLPQRQTVLVAKQAAALDVLSGGRLRLGVGVGRNWMEYEALNEQFTNRGKRIEEQVEVLRRLWTEELVTFDGAWHHLDRVGINPLPRATSDPDLDGVVLRPPRRVGARACRPARRRMDAAVPARRRSRRRARPVARLCRRRRP